VGVVGIEGSIDVRRRKRRGGEEEDVVARFAGVEEGRFLRGGAGGDQTDAATGRSPEGGARHCAIADAWLLVLIDVLDPIGILGYEGVVAVEEQAAAVGEIAGLVARRTNFVWRPARDRGGKPMFLPDLGAVDERKGRMGRLAKAVRTGAGRVARRAPQGRRFAGGASVIEIDLLVGLAADRVTIVISGERLRGHEGKPLAVGGDSCGHFHQVSTATPACKPVGSVAVGQHRDQLFISVAQAR
jgi:hypothetical protein